MIIKQFVDKRTRDKINFVRIPRQGLPTLMQDDVLEIPREAGAAKAAATIPVGQHQRDLPAAASGEPSGDLRKLLGPFSATMIPELYGGLAVMVPYPNLPRYKDYVEAPYLDRYGRLTKRGTGTTG